MALIEHNKLTKGQKVWYDYENSEYPASGPFKIIGFFSNHEGRQVQLSGPAPTRGVRNVCLASEDDYGEPRFYTAKPA